MMWKKILRNAGILGGIVFLSNLIVDASFSWPAIWKAFLAGLLIAFIEIKYMMRKNPVERKNHRKLTTLFL